MGRMDVVNARLSSLRDSDKRVVYFVTEDRDFLRELFRSVTPTLKAMGAYSLKDKQWHETNFYKCATRDGYLVDIYEMLQLSDIQFDVREKKTLEKRSDPEKAVFFFMTDFHLLKKTEKAGELLKQFISYAQKRKIDERPVFLFLVSPILQLPMGFEQDVEILDVPDLSIEDIAAMLQRVASREVMGRPLHSGEISRCYEAAQDFKGISRKEILQIVRELQNEYGSFFGQQGIHCTVTLDSICESRQELISEYKKRAAKADKTVTLLDAKDAISGMDAYFSWLEASRNDFKNPEEALEWGIYPPKGVLLTGVPGSGKTQAAKKTAYVLSKGGERVSLVQLRMDNLLGGRVGDSEANFKRCRKRVEALAPAVVLIDEIEKLFSEKSHDSSGVRTNLLAALLDWLQENKKQIFFFATSNSVEGLPPELLRDGRFDMRYCAFMPSHRELEDIIEFHLKSCHKMSGDKQRFSQFQKSYKKLAREFLDKVTEYAESAHKDMFFTGSNIENLIKQTNQELRSQGIEKPTRANYLDVMLRKAKSDSCQPYGETNMESIVNFWILARKNKYASTSDVKILPFEDFDPDTGKFNEDKMKKASFEYEYDRYLRQRLCEEIEKAASRKMEAQK